MIQQEGPGWRLARDLSRADFPALIGGEGWAFELTQKESQVLMALLCELTDQHQALQSQLMSEECIELEMELEPWWGCLEGSRESWGLRVVLEGGWTGRGVEGHWPAPAAQAFVAAMRTAWDTSGNKQG